MSEAQLEKPAWWIVTIGDSQQAMHAAYSQVDAHARATARLRRCEIRRADETREEDRRLIARAGR
jgi:hypothetical protein